MTAQGGKGEGVGVGGICPRQDIPVDEHVDIFKY